MKHQQPHQAQRNIPITVPLPESMVEKGLESQKEKLAKEFREAALDKERASEIELWDTLK